MSMLSSGIAAAPTQKVSLDDLTAMGLDRLSAMASGQQASIAPSYLIVAAIEALKKGKSGQQDPQSQGTVKDQLLASLQPKPMPAPPGQMGIGQLKPPMPGQQPAPQPAPGPQAAPPPGQPPTQMMSGGGKVRHFLEGGTTGTQPTGGALRSLLNGTTDQYNAAPVGADTPVDSQTAEDRQTLAKYASLIGNGMLDAGRLPYGILAKLVNNGLIRPINALGGSFGKVPVADSWTPNGDAYQLTQKATPNATADKTAPKSPVPPMGDISQLPPGSPGYNVPTLGGTAASITAPPDQRGLGDPLLQKKSGAFAGNGLGSLKDYPAFKPDTTKLEDIKFDLPEATRTQAAYDDMKQTPERLAQMKSDAQSRALAAFAMQGGKPNQHLGSLIAQGGAAYANTMADQNDKINSEQMQYKMAQAQLGQSLDKFGFEKTLNTLNGKQAVQNQLYLRSLEENKANVDMVKDYNANRLKMEEIRVRWGEVRAAAQARTDNQALMGLDKINNEASQRAMREAQLAEKRFKDTLKPTETLDDSNVRGRMEMAQQTAAAKAYNDYMRQTLDIQNRLRKNLGMPPAEL